MLAIIVAGWENTWAVCGVMGFLLSCLSCVLSKMFVVGATTFQLTHAVYVNSL